MKRYGSLVAVVACMLVVALASPSTTEAGQIFRLSAEWSSPDNELFTSSSTPGVFYSKTFTVPLIGTGTTNTYAFISLYGVADVHGGEGLVLSCALDGNQCHVVTTRQVVQKLPTDEHDNNVVASWCIQAEPGSHTVDLSMASEGGLDSVFMENIIVYIDASRLGQGACAEGAFVSP